MRVSGCGDKTRLCFTLHIYFLSNLTFLYFELGLSNKDIGCSQERSNHVCVVQLLPNSVILDTLALRERINRAEILDTCSASRYVCVTDPLRRETRCQIWYTCQRFTGIAVGRNDGRVDSFSATERKLKGYQNFLV